MLDTLPEVEMDDEQYSVLFMDGRSFYLKARQGRLQMQMYTADLRSEVLIPIGEDLWQDSAGNNHQFSFEVNSNVE